MEIFQRDLIISLGVVVVLVVVVVLLVVVLVRLRVAVQGSPSGLIVGWIVLDLGPACGPLL